MCECDYGNNVASMMKMERVTYEERKEPEPGKKNAAETCGPTMDKTLEPMGTTHYH